MPHAFTKIHTTTEDGWPRRLRAIAAALAATAAFISAPAANAGDHDCDVPPREVHHVELAAICDACGVVTDVRVERREAPGHARGAVAGALVGGLAGHGLGDGSGRAAMTVLGAIGGGVAGNAIDKKIRHVTVWSTTVTFKDGSVASYERHDDPELERGDVVRIEGGQPQLVEPMR